MSTHELMPDANNVLILCIKINLFFLTWPRPERERQGERGTQASKSSVYSCPESGGEEGGKAEAEEAGAAEDSDSDSGMYKYLHHVPSSECQCKYFQTLMK